MDVKKNPRSDTSVFAALRSKSESHPSKLPPCAANMEVKENPRSVTSVFAAAWGSPVEAEPVRPLLTRTTG